MIISFTCCNCKKSFSEKLQSLKYRVDQVLARHGWIALEEGGFLCPGCQAKI